MDKLNQSFPDPSQFKDKEEWDYAAMVASVWKKVGAELLGWIDGQIAQAKFLQKKEKGEVKEVRIGQ